MKTTSVCVDCNRVSLGKAGKIPDNCKLDEAIEFLRDCKVKICAKCGRVYGEHGEELTISGKKIYFRDGRFVLIEEINFYYRKKEYGWLSNFWRCWQEVDGIFYPANEYYYQAEKAKERDVHIWISNAPNPYLAMQAGRSLRKGKELVDDWDSRKVDVMLKGLRAKFEDAGLREKLLETGDAVIHEDSPTDMFWGIRGKDMLGRLLMQVRNEIKEEEFM